MADEQPIRIPLRNHRGDVRAYAVIDAVDIAITEHRWCLTSKGYAYRMVRREHIAMHRVVLGLVKGDGLEGDHIDRDHLNNRRSNLRVVTRGQNKQNMSSNRGTSSRYRGVSWRPDKNRWVAQAQAHGQYHYLGLYELEEEAAEVALAFRLAHMPYATDSKF
jgi:hypothetical protein